MLENDVIMMFDVFQAVIEDIESILGTTIENADEVSQAGTGVESTPTQQDWMFVLPPPDHTTDW